MSTNLFARALAGAESQEQADFFNEFCSSMMGICKGREGMQLWYVGEKLDESAAKMLRELADLRDYHKAEYVKDTLRRDDLRREIHQLEDRARALKEATDG